MPTEQQPINPDRDGQCPGRTASGPAAPIAAGDPTEALRELAERAGWYVCYAGDGECCVAPTRGATIALEPALGAEDEQLHLRIDMVAPPGQRFPASPTVLRGVIEYALLKIAELVGSAGTSPAADAHPEPIGGPAT